MKKTLSIVICFAIVLCCAFTSAAVCVHSYNQTSIAATCVDRAHTLKTCSICGNTTKDYEPLYIAPDSFYFAVEGNRSQNTLNVSVTVYNNPGFWANRLTLNYNTDALEVISTEKGSVWPSTATITVNSTPASGSPYVRFYCDSSLLENNTNNGLVFSVTFNIIGEMDDWDISLTAKAKDVVNVEGQAVQFNIVDTVTLGYGDHVYDEGSVITHPTYETEGSALYRCTLCVKTKTEVIPPLEYGPNTPGDIDGDGVLNSTDILIMKRYLVGFETNAEYLERMDINCNGKINAVDLLYMKKMILGII